MVYENKTGTNGSLRRNTGSFGVCAVSASSTSRVARILTKSNQGANRRVI